jgi:catalase
MRPCCGATLQQPSNSLLAPKHARVAAHRLARGPVAFNVVVQIAQAGDQLLDPTEPWPADRAERVLGRVVIDRITDAACERETFIPTSLPAGLEPSNDPVLQARAAAYGVSLSRRLAP